MPTVTLPMGHDAYGVDAYGPVAYGRYAYSFAYGSLGLLNYSEGYYFSKSAKEIYLSKFAVILDFISNCDLS